MSDQIQYLDKLKKNLPHGCMARIAKKHGVSRSHVCGIVKGTTVNESIMLDLIKEAEAHKSILAEIEKRFKAL